MSTPTTVKVDVLLSATGHIAGASTHTSPATGDVNSGMLPTPGQQVLTIEVASSVTKMDAAGFLAHLAEHAAIKSATAQYNALSVSSGQEPTTGTV